MPDTMIERVARAMLADMNEYDGVADDDVDGWQSPSVREIYIRQARAAIAAMMEPTDVMVETMIMQTALDPQRTPDAYSAVRHAYRAALAQRVAEAVRDHLDDTVHDAIHDAIGDVSERDRVRSDVLGAMRAADLGPIVATAIKKEGE
jgi:hypothetical protein